MNTIYYNLTQFSRWAQQWQNTIQPTTAVAVTAFAATTTSKQTKKQANITAYKYGINNCVRFINDDLYTKRDLF